MIPVVGVDPGGQTTGIVARHGNMLDLATLVTRKDWTFDRYLREVVAATGDALRLAREIDDRALLALEDLTHPNPHMGLANVMGLLDTAQTIGALRLAFRAVMVPPGRNGSRPLHFYPTELVGPHEAKGTGKLRHCRSAWDVAGAAKTVRALR